MARFERSWAGGNYPAGFAAAISAAKVIAIQRFLSFVCASIVSRGPAAVCPEASVPSWLLSGGYEVDKELSYLSLGRALYAGVASLWRISVSSCCPGLLFGGEGGKPLTSVLMSS